MASPDRGRPGRRRATPQRGRNPGKRVPEGEPGPPEWGALARRGGRTVKAVGQRGGSAPPPVQGPRAPRDDDVWVREDVRSEAEVAVARGDTRPRRRARTAATGEAESSRSGDPAAAELAQALSPARAARARLRLKEAARAFDHEQFVEARRLLRPLAKEAPRAASVRELLGLTYYRLGQWTSALRELEAFRSLTGSTEQHPVLADCYRALKRWPAMDALWEELREASPSAALVAEGRIVTAGALADRGRLPDAVALLEAGRRRGRRVQTHHLRLAYALADLRERAGDLPGARDLFAWVSEQDPSFADAAERRRALA